MNCYADGIGISLPYIFAIILQFVGNHTHVFARGSLPKLLDETSKTKFSEAVKNLAVDLAAYTYGTVTFVFSTLASVISSVVFLVLGDRHPLIIIASTLVILAALSVMAWWVIVWGQQPVAVVSRSRRLMKIWSYISVVLLWALALVSRTDCLGSFLSSTP